MKKSMIVALMGIAFTGILSAQTSVKYAWDTVDAVADAGGFAYTVNDSVQSKSYPLTTVQCAPAVAPKTGTTCTGVGDVLTGSKHSLVLQVKSPTGVAFSPALTGTSPTSPSGFSITITVVIAGIGMFLIGLVNRRRNRL